MSIPYKNLSDNKTIQGYVNATDAQLKIMSVPTQRQIWFPAFLTDFSQTFDATWNTEDVFGRMDPIATYQGTKRTMSLGFDLPAGSLQEAKDNLEGCSELVKMVYPIYSSKSIGKVTNDPNTIQNNAQKILERNPGAFLSDDRSGGTVDILKHTDSTVLSKPPLVRIKFANLISGVDSNGLLGWISGLSWKPNLEMGMFTSNNELYPKIIGMSFSFNILHEETLNQEAIGSFPFGGK
jgi:hypothetical protein